MLDYVLFFIYFNKSDVRPEEDEEDACGDRISLISEIIATRKYHNYTEMISNSSALKGICLMSNYSLISAFIDTVPL
jgi:hypothetical protein